MTHDDATALREQMQRERPSPRYKYHLCLSALQNSWSVLIIDTWYGERFQIHSGDVWERIRVYRNVREH